MYENIQKVDDVVRPKKPSVNINFIDGPYVELVNFPDGNYVVDFITNGQLFFSTKISSGMWARVARKYYSDWNIVIKNENGAIIQDYKLNLNGKRVLISFESKSLGDTLAWIPYVEEFRKKHNCQLIVSTFMNHLFQQQYPNIEFIDPGKITPNLSALYRLGWFYDGDGNIDLSRNPSNFRQSPLQKCAAEILGIEYKEIRPLLNLPKKEKLKKVGIAIHSTAQSKYWNNPIGWQQVVDYLRKLGYEVVLYSREEDGYMGNRHPVGITKFKAGSIEELISDMLTCEFFIGIGSGLSWLAWACELPVVLISGFSEWWTEMTTDTFRVVHDAVCHGCFNHIKLDPADWNWCPQHKETPRQFECTRTITSDMVIKQIEKILS